MYRSTFAFIRNVSNTIGAAGSRQASRQALLYSPFLYPRERYQSTKASNLKKVIPEFWILKMKTAFAYHDVGGDGYITEEDFVQWAKHMEKLFPNMSEEKKKMLKEKQSRVWGDLLGGKGKGPDYKVTELH